jgi:hypothetical protein
VEWDSWLAAWLGEAVVACLIGVAAAARKSHKAGMPLLSGPGRKFLLGFAPPLLAGALLTLVLFRAGFDGGRCPASGCCFTGPACCAAARLR